MFWAFRVWRGFAVVPVLACLSVIVDQAWRLRSVLGVRDGCVMLREHVDETGMFIPGGIFMHLAQAPPAHLM